MHQPIEISKRTYAENKALFELYWMGREEARRGRPLRAGHDLGTASQYQYRKGYADWKAYEEEHGH